MSQRHNARYRLGFSMVFALVASICVGSDAGAAEPAQQKAAAPQPAPSLDAVLDRLLDTYQQAKSYRDQALVSIHLHTPQGKETGDFDATLAFERPNRLRMEFQPAILPDQDLVQRLVVADGKHLFIRSEEFPKQVLVADDPTGNLGKALLASKEIGPKLSDGVAGGGLVLRLLTSKELPAPLDRAGAKLLESAEIDGRRCDRVQFTTKEGVFTLWVDRQTGLLRRIEYPADKPLEALKQHGITRVEVVCNLNDAAIDAPIPADLFAWKKTEGDQYVKHFVAPAESSSVPELLGKPVPEFQFTTAKAEKLTTKAFAGKVVVIDFWATWCGWCLKGMPGVEAVRKKYAGNDKVQFLALSEDNDDVSDQQIVDLLKQLKVELPWARIAGQGSEELNTLFGFSGIPAMVVLGADGRVQYYHVGFDPQLEAKLPRVIDDLLAGKDLSAEAVKARDEKRREFQRQLDAARVELPADK